MSKRQKSERRQLQNVLERHGANPDNWPAGERAGLLALVERDRAAAQLFDEAGALDYLLDLAVPDAGAGGGIGAQSEQLLQDRILRDFAARNKDAGSFAGAGVADLPGTGKGHADDRGRGLAWQAATGFSAANWMTAGALAACFALGIFLGGYGLSGWQLDPVASFSGDLAAGLAEGRLGGQVAEIGDLLAGSGTGEELL